MAVLYGQMAIIYWQMTVATEKLSLQDFYRDNWLELRKKIVYYIGPDEVEPSIP